MKNFLKTCAYEAKSLFLLFTQTKKGGHATIKHEQISPVKKETTLKRFAKWWR